MTPEEYIHERTTPDLIDLVRAFQKQNDLVVDGKFGPKTLDAVRMVLPFAGPWPRGIDVSHHQTLGSGFDSVEFAFVKATEGTTYSDPMTMHHLDRLSTVTSLLGIYHFARPSNNPSGGSAREADHFLKVWETAHEKFGKLLPPVLDIEDDHPNLPKPAELIDWCACWCERVSDRTGRQSIIYTYSGFLHLELGGYSRLSGYPLWLADYRRSPPDTPTDFPGWPWLFWQYTSTGSVRGISGDCDLNVFRGTKKQLEALLA